jgi:hypothetical protein
LRYHEKNPWFGAQAVECAACGNDCDEILLQRLFCTVAFVNLMHRVKPRRVSLISLFVAFCLENGGYDISNVFQNEFRKNWTTDGDVC